MALNGPKLSFVTLVTLAMGSCTHTTKESPSAKSAYDLPGSTELTGRRSLGPDSILPSPHSRESVYRYIVTTPVNEVQESHCLALSSDIRTGALTVLSEQDLSSLVNQHRDTIKNNIQKFEPCFVRLSYRVDRHLTGIATETFTDQIKFFYQEFLVLSVLALNIDSISGSHSSIHRTWLRDWYIYLSTEHFGRSLNWIEDPEDFTTAGPYGRKAESFQE